MSDQREPLDIDFSDFPLIWVYETSWHGLGGYILKRLIVWCICVGSLLLLASLLADFAVSHLSPEVAYHFTNGVEFFWFLTKWSFLVGVGGSIALFLLWNVTPACLSFLLVLLGLILYLVWFILRELALVALFIKPWPFADNDE